MCPSPAGIATSSAAPGIAKTPVARLRHLRVRKENEDSRLAFAQATATSLPMKHPVHITPVRKDPPDLDRFVAALLALAIARVAEREETEKTPANDRRPGERR